MNLKRMKQIVETVRLQSGAHKPDSTFCVMELAAFIAGEKWSDSPECVSPVIATFLRSWNDSLADEPRQMLKPYAVKCLNTRGTKEHEDIRAWMAVDWLVRECAPAFLRCAGLTAEAESFEKLARITGEREAKEAQYTIDKGAAAARAAAGADARAAAWAARAAAWAAAWAAARAAAWAAARAAAWATVRAAAGAAAGDAAWAAARAAAGEKLAPTVRLLQASALELLDRMIEVHQTQLRA